MKQRLTILEYTALEDNQLAKLLATNNDQTAYNVLYSRYFDAIKNFIGPLIKKDIYKEDIAQDIFIKVFRKIHLYDPKRKFSTWIYKVATNTAIDFRRKEDKKRTQPIERSNDKDDLYEIPLLTTSLTPLQILVVQQRICFSIKLLNCLDDKMKNLLIEKFIKEKTYQELSEEMKVSPNTLKTWISRLKKNLRIDLISEYLLL